MSATTNTANEEMFASINVYILEKFQENSPNLTFGVQFETNKKSNLIATRPSDNGIVARLSIEIIKDKHLQVGYFGDDSKIEQDIAFFSSLGSDEDVAIGVEVTFRIYLYEKSDINLPPESITKSMTNASAKILCSRVLVDLINGVPNFRFNSCELINEIPNKQPQSDNPSAICNMVIKAYHQGKIIATLQFNYLENMHLQMLYRESTSYEESSAYFSLLNNVSDVAAHVSFTFIDRIKMLSL
jgi:hypothetical protein